MQKYNLHHWKKRAKHHGVKSGERLSNARNTMSNGLTGLLLELDATGHNQSEIASILNDLGILAANGSSISNSKVSNTMRKALGVRRVDPYKKDNYKDKNWIICAREHQQHL